MTRPTAAGLLLRDRRDRLPVALAALHAAALCCWPHPLLVGLGLWWNANTVSHQFVHRRFFRTRAHDAGFSAALSVLLGFPQRLWRERHLAHHAGAAWRWRGSAQLWGECALVAVAWSTLAVCAPGVLLGAWLPGFALGQTLCALHGYFEHRGGTTSCRARWWNVLFLNDGWHAEHHARPAAHFRDLPRLRAPGARVSALPPVLRWLELPWLDACERAVLRSRLLQRFVLAVHRRALRALLRAHAAEFAGVNSVVVVGGGLFPRSALLLAELLPQARITVLDADAANLRRAAALLPAGVEVRCGRFAPGERLAGDLVVLPLALRGDRAACYAHPPAGLTLVHDWLWRSGERGAAVPWLLKRINLVRARARTGALAEAG
jgi:hypothetical protein